MSLAHLETLTEEKISKSKTPVFEGLPAASLALPLPELLEGPLFSSPSDASPVILVYI